MELDKIYNANCYEKIKEIPTGSIDCIYTDIPYKFTTGGTSKKDMGNRRKKLNEQLHKFDLKLQNNTDPNKHNLLRIDKYQAKKKRDISLTDQGINYSILDDFCRVMKKINIFIWCSKLQIPKILNYFINKGCYYDILVWAKTNAMPTNQSFLSDLEYCLYFREKGVEINNEYEYKSKWYCSCVNKIDKGKWVHPTIKPLEIVLNHLKLATKPNDVVFDPFAGSGTTGVACKILGRHYILIEEIEEIYNITNNRVNNQVDCNGQFSMFVV